MDTLSALDPLAWLPEYLPLHPAYQAGNALGWLSLENKQASTNYPLAGRLYVSKSGWLMLSVPNALVRGVYDALVSPGAELPGQERSDVLNAHISVMTAAEVSKIGPNKINERGHNFHYTLGALREITINKAGNLSRVWAIQISSPQLSAIRKSYGLSPLLKDEPFHITVACRRKGVLLNNGTSKGTAEAVQEISRGKLKAASADETTYDCGCSGSCMCPDTCVCKKTGCARKKTASEKVLLPGFFGHGRPHKPNPSLSEPGPYDANLHALLQQWDTKEPIKRTTMNPLSPEIAAALHKHLQLQKHIMPDELDAVSTLMELDDHANAAKTAAVYNFEGDVQGVSLRKTLHQILDERKHPGLAYNNAHTGEARAIIPGNKKHQEEILGILRKRLAERAAQNVVGAAGHKSSKRPLEEGVDYSITPLPGQRERMHPVTVTPDDVQNFVTAQGFDRLGAEPPAYQNQWLGERYRLAPDAAGNLVGAVPGLAKKQLFHGAPIYGYQTVPGWKDTKAAADITKLSPKWSNREHLLAALPKHLTDTQTAMSTPGGNVDKEMIDLGLIARAWLKSQQQKELLAARFKKFQETSAYPSLALQTPSLTMATKGARHEYTNNDQVTKEIAPDHLPEEPAGYKKVREIEKPARPRIIEELLAAKNHSDNKRYGHKSQILRKLMEQSPQDWVIDDSAPKFQGITHTPTKFRFHTDRTAIPTGVKAANTGSVYGDQLTNILSQPVIYDRNKPVFDNVKGNMSAMKSRGDFMLQAKRNNQQYRAALDPKYRYQLAMQAFNGQMEQPALVDQIIEQHGDRLLNMAGVPR